MARRRCDRRRISAVSALGAPSGWLSTLDPRRDFLFGSKTRCLIVRSKPANNPFSRILKPTYDDGDDSVVYVIRLRLQDPGEEIKLNDRLMQPHYELKELADKINRFLNKYRPGVESIDLADADLVTMAKGMLANLWRDATTDAPAVEKPAPVIRDGDVLFVCPECGYQTDHPGDQPPFECAHCSKLDNVVLLQDRTPGRTVLVTCGCGI